MSEEAMSSLPTSRRSILGQFVILPVGLIGIPKFLNRMGGHSGEPQPHMEAALEQLRGAKAHLKKATADKGGHRLNALAHVDKAIEETKAGIAFDNLH
jgi:hypothetical protein